MARTLNRLSARSLSGSLKAGLHADGGGLYLRVTAAGTKSWTFIYQMHGRRRETGFGSATVVSLSDARDKRDAAKKRLAAGEDPSMPVVTAGEVTFGEAADALIKALSGGWKNPKHRAQWRSTLETYCDAMWGKAVADIDTNDVVAVLTPIWTETPETASRLRGRIERVLDAAKVKGHRSGDNPARWRGHLEVILPKRKKKSAVRHHPALPYEETPAFVAALKSRVSTAARALEFLILTAGRTSEVIGMKWQEVDFDAKLWVVPADRMKMGVEHRVPLSEPALLMLNAMKVFGSKPADPVFPSQQKGGHLSMMAMEMLLRRMRRDDITVHGFRSSFRDWAGEETEHPREIAEAALAHQVGNAVERSYRRGDALAKRRRLMDEWGAFVAG